MKRKVVKQGEATLMISLPSTWTKKLKISKGDEVEITEQDSSLIVSKGDDSASPKKRAVINIDSWVPLTNRLLLSFFLKGFDELEIHYSNPEQIKRFQKEVIVTELLSWEIIRQSPGVLVVKDLFDNDVGSFDEVFNRLMFMIDNMCSELITGLESKHSLEIVESDKVINRLAYYCLRLLNKKGYKVYSATSQVYSIITLLEETADLFKDVAKQKIKVLPEDLSALKQIRISLGLFKEVFLNFSRDKVLELARQYEKIKKLINKKSEMDSYLHGINGNIIRANNELLIMNVDSLK